MVADGAIYKVVVKFGCLFPIGFHFLFHDFHLSLQFEMVIFKVFNFNSFFFISKTI